MMSTLTAHYQWEVETTRERTGHPPSVPHVTRLRKNEVADTSYPWLP